MGLFRRKFTREMKMTAIQRLQAGASIGQVARAFEVMSVAAKKCTSLAVEMAPAVGLRYGLR